MECLIRKWKIEDAERLATCLNNKKILDNLRDGLPFPYKIEDAKFYIELMLGAEKEQTYAFAITVDGMVVGSIAGFRGQNIHFRTAEIGYYVAEEFWNKGVCTNAIKQLCSHIFKNTDIVRVYAEPFAHNIGSIKALEKAGFVFEGLLRKNAQKNGKLCDMKMYARIKD